MAPLGNPGTGGALEGIRVLQAGMIAVGPYAGSLLGTLGADVIRLHTPLDYTTVGEPTRNGKGLMFYAINFNQRNILLDLRNEEHKAIALKLAERADVFIENYRLGVMDRVGLGYEALAHINPRIVYCSMPPYGTRGPLSERGAADPYMQAFTGFASTQGVEGSQGEAFRSYGILDVAAAVLAAQGIVLALREREISGRGQRVVFSLMQTALNVQETRFAEYLATGQAPTPHGSAASYLVPSQAFHCQDGDYIFVSARTDEEWLHLAQALGRPDLAQDPRFSSNHARLEKRAELIPILEELFEAEPSLSWWLRLRRFRVPCALRSSIKEHMTSEYLRRKDLVLETDSPVGKLKFAATPIVFSETKAVKPTYIHDVDADRLEILAELDH
ncbi:MAG: CoA transferase [Chloroflexota bacterium]|nr:MAG: CoA transferase [Chloroflexota bacterium]